MNKSPNNKKQNNKKINKSPGGSDQTAAELLKKGRDALLNRRADNKHTTEQATTNEWYTGIRWLDPIWNREWECEWERRIKTFLRQRLILDL